MRVSRDSSRIPGRNRASFKSKVAFSEIRVVLDLAENLKLKHFCEGSELKSDGQRQHACVTQRFEEMDNLHCYIQV
jgi:hypothetical protein